MQEHNSGTAGVHRFTKNNYFYGKLLTVEDMAAEQAYHSGVQRTLSRFVTDWGGVCGLKVTPKPDPESESDPDQLTVTVHEGLALDRCGRLIVVGDEQHETITVPPEYEGTPTDRVAVYVEYDECFTDPVPAAKMESACEEECKDNHIVEQAEVTVEPVDPDESLDYHKDIAEIDFSKVHGLGDDPGEDTIDDVLSGLARSYYENEPRVDCGEVDDGRVLVGVLTADSEAWDSVSLERGPLLYTNDMLFDILTRHVADFDNPHDVSLSVDSGTDGADAHVGVEEAGGLTGSVDLTSSDDSIAITPDHDQATIDLVAERGLGDAFEEYYVYEQALHNTVEAYTELIENARDVWAPELVSHLAFRIARTAKHGLEDGVHEDPEAFVDFLEAPHTDHYPGEQLPFEDVESAAQRLLQKTEQVFAEEYSIVDLEYLLGAVLAPNDRADPAVPVESYHEAIERLGGVLQGEHDESAAFDAALAQHRVAEVGEGVLDSYPAVDSNYYQSYWAIIERYLHRTMQSVEETENREYTPAATAISHRSVVERSPFAIQEVPLGLHHRPVAQPSFGQGLVPELEDAGRLTPIVHRLRMGGWTYLIKPVDEGQETPSHQVVGQLPDPASTANKAPGMLLEVNDPVSTNDIEGIGDNFRKDLDRFGIATISELILAGPSVIKIATGAPLDTIEGWIMQAVSLDRQLAWTAVSNVDKETVKVIAQLENQVSEAEGREFISPSEKEMTADEVDSFIEDVTTAAETYDLADHERNRIENVNWDNVRTYYGQ